MELEEARGYVEGVRQLLQHSGLPFLELDAAGRVTSCSRQAAAALGARADGASGQLLEAVVANRHRAQVAQALKRAQGTSSGEVRPSAAKLPGASGRKDAILNLMPCYSRSGRVTGVLGLVSEDNSPADTKLPAPVSGVNAWRCTMGTSAAIPCMFELSEGKDTSGSGADARHSESFRSIVEQTVKDSAPIHLCEPGAGATPFESEVMPFESQGGETRYFCVRGLATCGPEMPFGGRISIAEGYVVDITRAELALQEASRWHERWRALSQLVFDFALLVDITEYRILSVWDESAAFDEKLEGRSLMDYVEGPDDRAVLSDAISAALVAHAGAQQPLTFWNPRRKERIYTRCAMVSDAWDPSALFMGASLVADGQPADPGLVASAPTKQPTKGSSSSNDVVASRQLMMLGGRAPQTPEPSPAPPPEPSKPPAPPGASSGGGNKVVSLGSAPLRLSQAALGLAGLPPRKPPGLHRMGETPVASHGGNSESPAVQDPAPAEEDAKKAPKEPPRAQNRPPGRPPAPLGAAPPPALVGAVRRGRADAMSDSGRSVRSESSNGTRRVFPTRLVVLADDGAERWRSSVQMLAEGVRAVALLAGDGLLRWGMPQEIADAIRQEAYVLNVRDNASGEMLQVADVTGTSMRNLQRHCGSDDELTIFLSPLEDSEDAFETA